MGLNLAPAIATPAKPLSRSERKRLETIPPTPAQRQEIASLLERQGGLSDPAKQKISGWLLKARGASELSAEDVDVIMRIANDLRIGNIFPLDQVMMR